MVLDTVSVTMIKTRKGIPIKLNSIDNRSCTKFLTYVLRRGGVARRIPSPGSIIPAGKFKRSWFSSVKLKIPPCVDRRLYRSSEVSCLTPKWPLKLHNCGTQRICKRFYITKLQKIFSRESCLLKWIYNSRIWIANSIWTIAAVIFCVATRHLRANQNSVSICGLYSKLYCVLMAFSRGFGCQNNQNRYKAFGTLSFPAICVSYLNLSFCLFFHLKLILHFYFNLA